MQTIDDLTVRESIRAFVYEQFPLARQQQLSDDASLLQNGLIDSLGTLDVVAYIETEFDLILDDEDLVSDNFESIDKLVEFVISKRV
ncbi:acyl carrier protein [Stratiformator vulcanicus]|uniref:Acyl carrier protein n=1 Tax=Stratiformator vulcanicus TaxID=2527980 RepID=A0A517QW79_9PLAN|nr:acyl carrier protein [Stratiformator vulcanicus]QDT35922.1 acyl carrier protein [Stratiformator vulcanicus]